MSAIRLPAILLLLLISRISALAESIPIRGYYFTFSRMPTFGLPEWERIFDKIREDGGNTVILWVGGGFRSRRYPITWQYNRDHKNIQSDFVRELIEYAHTRQIHVLLGYTPFSYDGVNQYAFEHPELKAVQKNGNLAKLSGIHCWGYALNPSKDAAQRFMLDYAREMFFDFYPNADGMLIESSDYDICFCPQCLGHYYEREFQFVKAISKEVWARKPNATIAVYPHYFSGQSVPGFHVTAARLDYDPRWTLFFTPHSAHVDPDLLKKAKSAIFWDSSVALKTPHQIQEGARTAASQGIPGYISSFESFSFQVKYPEGGERYLIGRRLKPFGFDWLPDGAEPYGELLVRVNRIAFREFTRNPNLEFAAFQSKLGKEIFDSADVTAVDDLLFLQESFFEDHSWFSASPLVAPYILRGRLEGGSVSMEQIAGYRDRLRRIAAIGARHRIADGGDAQNDLSRIARWITGNWKADPTLIEDHLR
jgi:hypothetical protein